ncbi:MAG: hypothetical protein SGPRY_002254, partial [Prymnesium sp.]
MGEAVESPVRTQTQRDKVIGDFTTQVRQYSTHPALLIWSFGNELNGVWNGYLQQLSKADDMGKGTQGAMCAWDERYDDLGGCWIHKGKLAPPGSACFNSSYCVYSRLFQFINEAAAAAKKASPSACRAVADVLVVSAFADVDMLSDKMRELWSGESADDATKSLFGDCAAVVTEKCVDMGNGGHGVLFDWVHNAPTLSDSTGNLACSGHGTCSTDWKQCGPGDFNTTSTPCCSCEPGFAGEGCEQLDAR